VDLAESAGMLAEETDPIARRTGSSVAVEASEPVWALGDEERVLQAGRALLANALVHTPPGTTVVVRARRDGDAAVLEIEDDGPGIALEQQDAIFERFYRLEGGIASGSGLGLSIARELANLMEGNVRLESRPGRTVFRLVLPAEPAGSVFT
jgi:two-component system OmpR family sensor kinase